ncbi:MAG: hypothetical protein BJ554DRAFT_7908, partial [Olpidium bornovanus]
PGAACLQLPAYFPKSATAAGQPRVARRPLISARHSRPIAARRRRRAPAAAATARNRRAPAAARPPPRPPPHAHRRRATAAAVILARILPPSPAHPRILSPPLPLRARRLRRCATGRFSHNAKAQGPRVVSSANQQVGIRRWPDPDTQQDGKSSNCSSRFLSPVVDRRKTPHTLPLSATHNGTGIWFDPNGDVLLIDQVGLQRPTGTVLARGYREGRSFYLDVTATNGPLVLRDQPVTKSTFCPYDPSLRLAHSRIAKAAHHDLWHRRLGHLGWSTMTKIDRNITGADIRQPADDDEY